MSEREALESAAAWLGRWASHVGPCRGGNECTCGLTAIRAEVEIALTPPDGDAWTDDYARGYAADWPLGMPVTKIKGSSWTGKIVGYYSTSLTPQGLCIESVNEPGSVQIYPVSAIRAMEPKP